MYTYIYICNICNIHVYICSQPQGLWPGHARMMNHLQVGKWISPTKRHLAAWEAPGERAEMVKSMAWFKGNLNRKPWFFPSNHGFFLQIFPQTNPMVKRWYFYVGFFMGLWDSLEFNGISTGFFIRFLRISWDLETPMSWFFTFVAKATALDAAEAKPVCQLKLMVNGHLPANMAGWYPSRNWGLTFCYLVLKLLSNWLTQLLGGRQVTVNSLSQWLGACNTQQRTASTGGFMLCLPVLKSMLCSFPPFVELCPYLLPRNAKKAFVPPVLVKNEEQKTRLKAALLWTLGMDAGKSCEWYTGPSPVDWISKPVKLFSLSNGAIWFAPLWVTSSHWTVDHLRTQSHLGSWKKADAKCPYRQSGMTIPHHSSLFSMGNSWKFRILKWRYCTI